MANLGWSYPAGCTSVPDDEPSLCEICGFDTDACICPECTECGEVGNLECYPAHGLVLVPGQIPLTEQVAVVDFDTATYVGDDTDGVYYTVAQGPANGWYMSAIADCDAFAAEIYHDDGPYRSEAEAMQSGQNIAEDWCNTNGVEPFVLRLLEEARRRIKQLETALLGQFPGSTDVDVLLAAIEKSNQPI